MVRLVARLVARASSWDYIGLVSCLLIVQGALNKSLTVESRGGRTPVELLTGVKPKTGVDHLAWMGVPATVGTITDEEMQTHLADMHATMQTLWDEAVQSQQHRRAQNKRQRKHKRVPRINIGDYVLVAMAKPRSKLTMTWMGPHVVIGAINAFVWVTEPLGGLPSQKPKEVHIARL